MRDIAIAFIRNDSGATAIEYGLIAMLVSAAIIGSLQGLGVSVNALWDENSSEIVEELKRGG